MGVHHQVMRYRVPVLLCALLVCSLALGVLPAAGQPDPGETELEIQLQDDGDAEWLITVAVAINDEDDREDFEAFAADFEDGNVGLDLGVETFERAAAEASAASDREMEIQGVRRESELVEATENDDIADRGLLRVAFTWESFGRVDENGTLYVDDAFNTTDGTWLPGLTADQSLTIRSPPGYSGPSTSPIGAEAGDLRWEGPQTFGEGYFNIVYPPSTGPGPTQNSGLSTGLVVGALVLSGAALLLGLYLLVARRRSDGDGFDSPLSIGPSNETDGADRTDVSSSKSAAGSGDTDSIGGTDVAAAGAAGSTDSNNTGSGAVSGGPAEPDPDLLSDEERVEYLLEQNGGRMKQATIVKETGWSNAKVSQLLSSMADDDRINKLRIGRENLISLPDEGVTDIETDDGDSDDA